MSGVVINMLTNSSWKYAGKLRSNSLEIIKSINALSLLFNRQRVKLRAALLALDLALDLVGSANPGFMPSGEEYNVIARDTLDSLMKDYDVDRYVTIDSTRDGDNRKYLISVDAGSSLAIKLMIMCSTECEYFVDDRLSNVRNSSGTYFQLVMKALTIAGRLFGTDLPRILLTHNPTIYGKILSINGDETIALSIWDLLRLVGVISRNNLNVDDISNVIDTAIHEFLHYVLDKRYLVETTFMHMTKRIPSVVDNGIIHELITWTLTPHVSKYVAECIKYGSAGKIGNTELIIQYPIKRRHVLTASRIINELLMGLDGNCG